MSPIPAAVSGPDGFTDGLATIPVVGMVTGELSYVAESARPVQRVLIVVLAGAGRGLAGGSASSWGDGSGGGGRLVLRGFGAVAVGLFLVGVLVSLGTGPLIAAGLAGVLSYVTTFARPAVAGVLP